MANPIPLELPPRDPRAELLAKLESAPLEHAEALLSAYDLLQGLHDQGALELLRGLVESKDQVLKIIVDAAKTPEAVRGMRNFIILAKLTAALDIEQLLETPEPLSLLQLLKKLNNEDSRRALTVLTSALEAVGKTLGSKK